MKKPDRFERMVAKRPCPYTHDAVVKLLRKEHRAVVRMVEKEMKFWISPSPLFDPGTKEHFGRQCRAVQCQEILSKLTERAR